MSLAEQDSETSMSSPSRQTTSTAQLLTETQSEKAECTAAFSTEPGSTAAATDVYMRFDRRDMSGECVIDGHRESVQLRVHSVANLWARLSGARLLNQIVRLRVIQGGLVGPARENNTYNEAGIDTGFERGTLNFFQITTMKLRTTPIRIVIRVRCPCSFINSLRVITVNTKTLAALSHVISSCLAPNQLQFHDHIVIAHGAVCTGITLLSTKYQGNYKSHHSSSPNTALELKNEHPFEGNGRRHELPIRISRVRGWDNAGTLNASVCSLTNRTLRCSPATACGPVTSGYGGGSDSLDNLLRLPAHCEPLFAQLETVNEHYLRLKHVLLSGSNFPCLLHLELKVAASASRLANSDSDVWNMGHSVFEADVFESTHVRIGAWRTALCGVRLRLGPRCNHDALCLSSRSALWRLVLPKRLQVQIAVRRPIQPWMYS